jgi:hypothetical protein
MLRNVCVPPAHLYYLVMLHHSVHHALHNLSQTLVLVERVVHVCRQSDVQSALQALYRHLDVVLMVQDLLQRKTGAETGYQRVAVGRCAHVTWRVNAWSSRVPRRVSRPINLYGSGTCRP